MHLYLKTQETYSFLCYKEDFWQSKPLNYPHSMCLLSKAPNNPFFNSQTNVERIHPQMAMRPVLNQSL
jgi:hypothetical protein